MCVDMKQRRKNVTNESDKCDIKKKFVRGQLITEWPSCVVMMRSMERSRIDSEAAEVIEEN